MARLADLRLNCLLVPLLGAAAGLAAIGTLWTLSQGHDAEARLDELQRLTGAWARLRGDAPPQELLDLAGLEPASSGAAVLAIEPQSCRLVCERSHGRLGPVHGREAEPDMLVAVHQPRRWSLGGGLIAIAVPMAAQVEGPVRIVYLETETAGKPLSYAPVGAAALLSLLGLALAWYLVRHIYLPVQALAAQAEALASGRLPERQDWRPSAETDRLSRAIAKLAARVRSETGKAPDEHA